MINLAALSDANLVEKPFRYATVEGFLPKDFSVQLLQDLPLENYIRSTRAGGSDKVYDVVNNPLLILGSKEVNPKTPLKPSWTSLVSSLQSESYRNALSDFLKTDLASCYQEITLKKYQYGDFISAHTDTEKVRATHMIFLNQEWDESWGGALCLLENDHGPIIRKFYPTASHSTVFVRSPCSWHSVEKIAHPHAERIALQVAFWNTLDRQVLPGRIENTVTPE